jgi:uncharacterized membrane protein
MAGKTENVENEKLVAILSYLLIGIIWFFVDDKVKKSSFAKFHVKQAIILFIAGVIYDIILGVLYNILAFPFASLRIFSLLYILSLLYYVPLVLGIIGIINALNDKENELPIIGKYAEKLTF